MAKFKTGLNTSRNVDEMRSVEVEIDFTSNALASILYRQGETVVLACCTKEARLPGSVSYTHLTLPTKVTG